MSGLPHHWVLYSTRVLTGFLDLMGHYSVGHHVGNSSFAVGFNVSANVEWWLSCEESVEVQLKKLKKGLHSRNTVTWLTAHP